MTFSLRRTLYLIEILFVPALLALVAALLLPAAGALFPRSGHRSVEEQVAAILQQVRRDAILTGRQVALRFDGEEQRFVWNNGEFVRLSGPRTAIDFLSSAGRVAVPALTFFPDGTCERIRMDLHPAAGESRQLAIDPQTCAPGTDAP